MRTSSGHLWPLSRPEMAGAFSGTVWPMPKKNQKRRLSTVLRATVSDSVRRIMGTETATSLGKRAGIGRRSVDRLITAETAANLDTVEAVSTALGVEAWVLFLKAGELERLTSGQAVRNSQSEPAPGAKSRTVQYQDRPMSLSKADNGVGVVVGTIRGERKIATTNRSAAGRRSSKAAASASRQSKKG